MARTAASHTAVVPTTGDADSERRALANRLPVFINPHSGSAERLTQFLAEDRRFRVSEVSPQNLNQAIQRALDDGHNRIVVGGGDGTIAMAASQLANENAELALIPGGTLNHFAQRMNIPSELDLACDLAVNGTSRHVGVGFVNEHLFINTSVVGSYVAFVRQRDSLRKFVGYLPATLIAGIRRLVRQHNVTLTLHGRTVRTPVAFVGVSEREIALPNIGEAKREGEQKLHLIVVITQTTLESLALVLNAAIFGTQPLERARQLENHLLEDIELHFRHNHRMVTIALDGELVKLQTPLNYSYKPNALRVVTPA